MKVFKKYRSVVMLAGLVTALVPMSAVQAGGGAEIGILKCHTIKGSGSYWLIHSSAKVECEFNHTQGSEKYTGKTGIGLGVDLSWNPTQEYLFSVVSGSSDTQPEANFLAGGYVGGKASATAGFGVGLSILVGGGDKSVSLVPIGVEGNTGFGVEAGINFLTLEGVSSVSTAPISVEGNAGISAEAETSFLPEPRDN